MVDERDAAHFGVVFRRDAHFQTGFDVDAAPLELGFFGAKVNRAALSGALHRLHRR